jgi:Ca2+-binding RTX toxin-like protein
MAIILGTSNQDMLDGSDFGDEITAKGGDDTVFAWSGDDLLDLGLGNDRGESGVGNDTVYGGQGDDTLLSLGGDDQLFGGDGRDEIVVNDPTLGGLGTANAGAGDDRVVIYSTSGGTLRGGSGTDVLSFINNTDSSLMIDLDDNLMNGGAAFSPGVTFSGFERLEVVSGAGNDTIRGGAFDDWILVGGGANLVDAKAGNDTVTYTARDASTLRGGEGDDTLIVDPGTSSLYFLFSPFDELIDDGSLSDIQGFEHFVGIGSEFDDVTSFGDGDDVFNGAAGRDSAVGRGGADMLAGEADRDTLEGGGGRDTLLGGSGGDVISGDGGNDRITGGAGDDRIRGGAGDDRIRLETGNDTVTGGSGADRFLFVSNESGLHTITDFEVGLDVLQFSRALLPGGPTSGPLDPSLLAFGTASGPLAQFVLTYSSANDTTTLLWDSNGDDPSGGTDSLVILSGQIALTVADILIL